MVVSGLYLVATQVRMNKNTNTRTTEKPFFKTDVFCKHVRCFSNVPQLPDRWHRNPFVTGHWLSLQTQEICATNLAFGAPHVSIFWSCLPDPMSRFVWVSQSVFVVSNFRITCSQRHKPRTRDCPNVACIAQCCEVLQNQASTWSAAETTHWHPLRWSQTSLSWFLLVCQLERGGNGMLTWCVLCRFCGSRGGGAQNAQVLLIRWHSQHGIQDGIKRRRCVWVAAHLFTLCSNLAIWQTPDNSDLWFLVRQGEADWIFSNFTTLILPNLSNLCARTCSCLAALRIHVSPVTSELLERFGTFDLELRGPVEMKVQALGTRTIHQVITWMCVYHPSPCAFRSSLPGQRLDHHVLAEWRKESWVPRPRTKGKFVSIRTAEHSVKRRPRTWKRDLLFLLPVWLASTDKYNWSAIDSCCHIPFFANLEFALLDLIQFSVFRWNHERNFFIESFIGTPSVFHFLALSLAEDQELLPVDTFLNCFWRIVSSLSSWARWYPNCPHCKWTCGKRTEYREWYSVNRVSACVIRRCYSLVLVSFDYVRLPQTVPQLRVVLLEKTTTCCARSTKVQFSSRVDLMQTRPNKQNIPLHAGLQNCTYV